jgi:NAD(P)-dependent dehydrogenase (short-subunit alcohol dehydrogenase family)
MGTKRKQPGPLEDSLDGSVVLITGAASGIGAATATALAARGARLVLGDVDEAGLEATVAAVGEDRAVAAVADVRDLAAVESLVAAGVERFGGIDVVVANAGIGSFGSVLNVDPETFRRVVDINLTGVFHTVRAALPAVIERQGYVLVVSSLAAFTASPGMAAYHASKAGAENFANVLRLEVAHLGVDVGSAHMCWVDTPMVQEAKEELSGFARALSRMPPPLNRTTDLETCVEAFLDGIARRRRRVYVPGWVGTLSRLRSITNSALGDRATLRSAPQVVADADADVARYGRSMSARMAQHLDRPSR